MPSPETKAETTKAETTKVGTNLLAKIDEAPLSDHKFYKQINHKKCGTANANRILGGAVAKIGSMPWMVLLSYRPKLEETTFFRCGGSLITPKFVLTAAHCKGNRVLEL